MKKHLSLLFALLFALAAPSFGQEYRGYSRHQRDETDRGSRLSYEVEHLNRMREHVREQIRRYRARWHVRRQFARIERRIDEVNYRFRRGRYDRRDLRRSVDRAHDELHQIERELRVRTYYRWQ